MGATELWLVRHGESVANLAAAEAMLAGHELIDAGYRDADVPLSDTGRTQAAALGGWLRDALPEETDAASGTTVWASSYLRAQQTIQVAIDAAGLDLVPLVDERLRDRELGVLDLLTPLGVTRRFPDEAARRDWVGRFYYRPPGGESWADVALRIRSFLSDADARDDADGGRMLVATHDAVVMLFLYVCTGMTEPALIDFGRTHTVTNASVTVLSRPSGTGPWTLEAFSSDEHLVGRGAPTTEHSGERDDDVR